MQSSLWFPKADLSFLAPETGGLVAGGEPKAIWHSTETSRLPTYDTGYFPNLTLDPLTGKTWQHIPADRAARALRNLSGGVETNRWNAFQIEVIGLHNAIPYHPIMHELAVWLFNARGVPLSSNGIAWMRYPDSFGITPVRMSAQKWASFSGHCGHMHVPENDHGDPGWPFPIDQILSGVDMEIDYAKLELAIANGVKRGINGALTRDGSTSSNKTALEFLQAIQSVGDEISKLVPVPPSPLPPV